MKLRALTETTFMVLAGALMIALLQSACNAPQDDDDCLNETTQVSPSGARHVLDVALPFKPGPLAVVTRLDTGTEVSRSSRVWLAEDGMSLYVLQDNRVWRVDVATGDRERVGAVDKEAGQITGSEQDDTLVVSDPIRGAVWVMDQTRLSDPVRIPVGAGPGALALGPGRRLAYVANEYARSLSLVDTGVGVVTPGERSVYVSSVGDGTLQELDGDGRLRRTYEGLPTRLHDLVILADGRELWASYSELLTTGDIGTLGDGDLVIDEGVVRLDLETGQVERFSLKRSAGSAREGMLASPTGLVALPEGRLAVALPGWGEVAVMDIAADSPTLGAVVAERPVPGEPRWLARAKLKTDWLYALDDRSATVFTLDPEGQILQTVSLP